MGILKYFFIIVIVNLLFCQNIRWFFVFHPLYHLTAVVVLYSQTRVKIEFYSVWLHSSFKVFLASFYFSLYQQYSQVLSFSSTQLLLFLYWTSNHLQYLRPHCRRNGQYLLIASSLLWSYSATYWDLVLLKELLWKLIMNRFQCEETFYRWSYIHACTCMYACTHLCTNGACMHV